MMAPNPCCCFTLQTGARIVGIIQIIGGIIATVFWIGTVVIIREQFRRHGLEFDLGTLLVLGIISLAILFAIILGGLILVAANQKNIRKCKVWLNLMIVLTLFYVLTMVYNEWTSGFGILPLQEIVYVIVNIYMIWVVYAFMQEVESCPKLLPKTEEEEE